MDPNQESKEGKYLYVWTDEDRKNIKPLRDAMRSKARQEVISAAHNFVVAQLGVPPDDLDQITRLPRWITNEELASPDRDFDKSIVVVLPGRNLITKKPESGFLVDFFNLDTSTSNKSLWFKIVCDDNGVKGGAELVDYYKGVPFEAQDEPDNPELN